MKILRIVLPFLLALTLVRAQQPQNVQKTPGTNAITGPLVIGTGQSVTPSGSGVIIATGGTATTMSWGGLTGIPSPTLSATGDATGAWTLSPSGGVSAALTLATVNSNVGTFAAETVNAKGLVTGASNLSGDATTSGSVITFATVNANAGTFAGITVNGKGLVTGATALTSLAAYGVTNGAAGDALIAVASNGLLQRTAANTYSVATFTGSSIAWTAGNLALSGDSASPGNNFVYGTNSSGVKGWYAESTGFVTSIAGTANQITSSAATGAVVLSIPSAFNPPGTVNGLTFTANATGFKIAGGTTSKTAQFNNTLTFAGTDGTTETFPSTSATIARTDAGQTFTGTNAFAAITATTVNGLTLTANTTGFSIAGGTTSKTLTMNNTLTFAGTDGTTITFGSASGTVAMLGATQTFTGVNTFSSAIATPGLTSPAGMTLTTGGTTGGVSVVGSATLFANYLFNIGNVSGNAMTVTGDGRTIFGLQNTQNAVVDINFNGLKTGTGSPYLLTLEDGTNVMQFVNASQIRSSGTSMSIGANTYGQVISVNTPTANNVLAVVGSSVVLGGTTNNSNGVLQFQASTSATGGIVFGNDTTQADLYRNATSSIKTDGSFGAGGNLTTGGNLSLSGTGISTPGTGFYGMFPYATYGVGFDSNAHGYGFFIGASTEIVRLTDTTGSRFGLASVNTSAWGSTGIILNTQGSTFTDGSTTTGNTAALETFVSLAAPTLAASATSVTTGVAATFYIAGAPIQGTNQNILIDDSLLVAGGQSEFGGQVNVNGTNQLNMTATGYTFGGAHWIGESLAPVAGTSGGSWGLDMRRWTGTANNHHVAYFGQVNVGGTWDVQLWMNQVTSNTQATTEIADWSIAGMTVATTTASISTTSGAIVDAGGLGVAGAVNIGGSANITGSVTGGGFLGAYYNLNSNRSIADWGLTGVGYNNSGGITYNDTTSSGTVTAIALHAINRSVLTATTATTFTDGFTWYFAGTINNGSNASITRNHAVGIIDQGTTATSSITGGLIIAGTFGTAAGSVGIGGGAIFAGGLITGGGLAENLSTYSGTVTLTSGAGTITSAAITTSSAIFLTRSVTSGTATQPLVTNGSGSATVAGAATDNGTYIWKVIN